MDVEQIHDISRSSEQDLVGVEAQAHRVVEAAALSTSDSEGSIPALYPNDKATDMTGAPKKYAAGIYPMRPHNHLLSLLVTVPMPFTVIFTTVRCIFDIVESPQGAWPITMLAIMCGLMLASSIIRIMYATSSFANAKQLRVPGFGGAAAMSKLARLAHCAAFLEASGLVLLLLAFCEQPDRPLAWALLSANIAATATFMAVAFSIHTFSIGQVSVAGACSFLATGLCALDLAIPAGQSTARAAFLAFTLSGVLEASPTAGYRVHTRRRSRIARLVPQAKLGWEDLAGLMRLGGYLCTYVCCFQCTSAL